MLLGVGAQSAPAYTAAQLDCATYLEQVRTEIQSRVGTVVREERAGRDGVLILRAEGADSLLEIVAWYDSLALWREGPEGRITPDAEGLLGGRWRGILDRSGHYSSRATPFVPDEVAEIAELRGVLQDFLPLLPDSALAPGAKYRWSRRVAADSTTIVQDSLAVPVRTETAETGSLDWDPRLGPVLRERTVTVTARIPPGKPFPRGDVPVLTQRVRVIRHERGCAG